MADSWDVVIIGGGIAGLTAAKTIKDTAAAVSVLIIDSEDRLPYKRTKLSKHLHSGFATDQFALEAEAFYDRSGIDLMYDTTVQEIRPGDRVVVLDDGQRVAYRQLILAAGSRPVFPANVREHERGTFEVLRSAADAERIIRRVRRARRVLVSGMGVLGVEVAEQLVRMDKQVTLVSASGQVMPRQLTTRAGELMEALLSQHGIDLRFHEEILSFEPQDKGGIDVQMIRGRDPYDVVVFCVGVVPNTDLATAAGLPVHRGVVVDQHLRTADPAIFAAGDAAEHGTVVAQAGPTEPGDGSVTCLWHAAEYQGRIAGTNAAAALGFATPVAYDGRLFRLKTEVFGAYFFSIGYPGSLAGYEVVEDEADSVYRACFYRNDRLCGVVMVNEPDRAREYERAVREGWPPTQLAAELPPREH